MKCEICNKKIWFWQLRLTTTGNPVKEKAVHDQCYIDEAAAMTIANTLDNMAKIKAKVNSPV